MPYSSLYTYCPLSYDFKTCLWLRETYDYIVFETLAHINVLQCSRCVLTR